MQEVFEKIIEKLEERSKEYNSGVRLHGKPEEMLTCDAIEIVKQAAAEYNNGWIPCSERLPDVPEGTEDDDCPEFSSHYRRYISRRESEIVIKNKEILALIEKKKYEVRCENCKHCNLGAYHSGKWYCRKISVLKEYVDIEKCFEPK